MKLSNCNLSFIVEFVRVRRKLQHKNGSLWTKKSLGMSYFVLKGVRIYHIVIFQPDSTEFSCHFFIFHWNNLDVFFKLSVYSFFSKPNWMFSLRSSYLKCRLRKQATKETYHFIRVLLIGNSTHWSSHTPRDRILPLFLSHRISIHSIHASQQCTQWICLLLTLFLLLLSTLSLD